MQCAQAEFLKKGFAGASMRSIAQQAGMTTGAIYRYFPDKNSLFEALVDPVIAGFKQKLEAAANQQTAHLNTQQILPEYADTEQMLNLFIGYIYEHFEAFDLLVNSSAGSSRADYVDALITLDVNMTRSYLEEMTTLSLPLPDHLTRYLPLLIEQSYRQLLEVVVSRMTREESQHYLELLMPFLYAGWSTVLKGDHHE
nr:TetR/AcrR family transcriptional regulator [Paenibacillus sp. FSL R7-0331]